MPEVVRTRSECNPSGTSGATARVSTTAAASFFSMLFTVKPEE